MPTLPTPMTPNLAVMLTRRCDMRCTHCSVASHPEVKDPEDDQRLRDWVRGAIEAGVRQFQFTGGEPMLRRTLLLELLAACRRAGVRAAMTTNGSWATSEDEARTWIKRLLRAGLTSLSVSYDRYHAEFMGPEPVLRIARACAAENFPLGVGVTRTADDEDLESLIAPFAGLERVHVRFYDVQWIGGARRLDKSNLRGEVEGFCSAACSAALTDDGRVTACNGPAYFSPADSPLVLGSAGDEPIGDLLQRHATDPILDHIRAEGPSGLRDLLQDTQMGNRFAFRDSYSGMCELCLHMTESPEVVTELRRQLDNREAIRAEDLARQQLVTVMRTEQGEFNRGNVNAQGVGSLVVRRIVDGTWPAGAESILGRADLDWLRLTDYLIGCNLPPVALALVDDLLLRRWAPRFVAERIEQAAQDCAVRAGIQWNLLERIDQVLGSVGARGVLLKGAAWLAEREHHSYPVRASGDIDVYVEPSAAGDVHQRLIEAGLKPSSEHQRSAEHHLSMLSWVGVSLEIHTSIMASRWGLPESEMLATALPCTDFDNLDSPGTEARILHAMVHCTAHLFGHGAKTAWELATHHRDTGAEGTDWALLRRWAASLRVPRAFWIPLTILAHDLALETPEDLLRSAPDDARFERLKVIGRRRIWTAAGFTHEDNVFVREGVHAMLEDSWSARAGSVGRLAAGSLQPWRRSSRARARSQRGASLTHQARSAISDWRRYRRILRATR